MASSYLNDLKNLFKSKKKLQEEENAQVQDAVEREKAIVLQLKELEDKYNSTLKNDEINFDEKFSPVVLERVSYEIPTDEEISEKAIQEVEKQYASKISDIKADAIDKIQKEEEKKNNVENSRAKSLQEVDDLMTSLGEKAKNKAVKQGVQRGSILENQIKDIESSGEQSKESINKSYDDKILDIDNEILSLEKEKNDALNVLDLKKAVDVVAKMDTLKSQRDKLKSEEIAKNNAIAKQEKDENIKIEKEKAKYIEEYNENKEKSDKLTAQKEKENGYEGEKLQNYAERYNIALDFYMSLDPDIALKALETSANMKHYLGNYYDKLKDVLSNNSTKTNNKYI